jgi:conjugative transfer region protein TrbK
VESRVVTRLAAVVLLAIAVVGAVLEVRQSDRDRSTGLVHTADNLLSDELQRCSSLGAAAAADAVCREAWVENRRRFFGHSSRPIRQIPPAVPSPAENNNEGQGRAAPQSDPTPDAVNAPDRRSE